MAEHEHAERIDGRWQLPFFGAFGVRRAANGAIQIIWTCDFCDFRSSAIPHPIVAERGIDIRKLPILVDYGGLYGRCIVRGCGSDEVELNHFAPQAIFGAAADDWPTSYLCVRHHREWGERVTPGLYPARRREPA